MDIAVIQKILSDAFKEHELTGNAPANAVITLITADLYRMFMKVKK
jgi:hypothetical protein